MRLLNIEPLETWEVRQNTFFRARLGLRANGWQEGMFRVW